MEITLEQFKQYIPSVTLDDPRIQLYLDDAKRVVKRDGFLESDEEFDALQKLAALALMQDDKVAGVKSASAVGNNPEGINSIGVAGINIGFQSPVAMNRVSTRDGKIGYYIDYENLKKRIWAYCGRVA
ncbi:MAG: hypothetical protein IPL26_19660 [Leptospiraceae bacterium]|nr:hypothetical protein [Leptospiraceae bacterium]